MSASVKYQIILQLAVLLAGMTGVLGDYIVIDPGSDGINDSIKIVFFRTGIAAISLFAVSLFIKKNKEVDFRQITHFILVGVIIALHWFSFFYSIKLSTVSVGVVCMSMMAFFMALLEPILQKRPISLPELLLSIVAIGGMGLIFGFEFTYFEGILWGLLSAFLAALFTLANSRFIHRYPSLRITKFEMLGAAFAGLVALIFVGEADTQLFSVGMTNWIYLFILGLLCTSAAFLIGVWIIKYVSPFTFSISLNLEPVYAIIIVLAIDFVNGTAKEQMSPGFYFGATVILLAVLINAYLKRKKRLDR